LLIRFRPNGSYLWLFRNSERDADIHTPASRAITAANYKGSRRRRYRIRFCISVLIRWCWRVGLERGCMSDPIALSACAPRTCTISHQNMNTYRIPALALSSISRSPGLPVCYTRHTRQSTKYSDRNDYNDNQKYHLSAPPQY
jgi:hypothetical protein